jgi:ribosomal protein S18 acetylase RimI-like enzyme
MHPQALLSRIEDAGLNASAPPQQRWVDGWLVRLSPGKAKRARCINAVAPGRRSIADKLARCDAVYAQAGLPLLVRITPFSQPSGLDAHLEYLGLQAFEDTRVMVLADLTAAAPPKLAAGMTVRAIALEPFAQRLGALRGSPIAQRQAHAERLARAPVPFFAFELCAAGDVVGCGQFALEEDLVGLYDIFTDPAARGRGHARVLCAHLLAQARERGAKHGYLQVDAANAPARAVYRNLGFTDGYAYHYRARTPGVA